MTDVTPSLTLQNISVRLDGRLILSDLSASFQPGEFVALLGASGCGKSTLLRAIVGEAPLETGLVRGPARFGYAPQRAPLLPWLSVIGNLQLARPPHMDKEEFDELIRRLLVRARLENTESLRPKALSGGMRGRVSLLRAFLTGSPVILMDEPFIGLDEITRELLHELLLDLWRETRPLIVFVTHDLSEALHLATRILVLGSDGKRFSLDRRDWRPEPPTELRDTIREALR